MQAHGRARLHRRADRRHGHVEPLEGVPRRRVEEPRRRRLPRSHPLAQGGRGEVSRTTTSRASASTATSAGGQNALGGAALPSASSTRPRSPTAGCHDNRMDKIWWNEQWMGWPLGPQYAASSNVDNADEAAGQAAAHRRRAGHQRRSVVDDAGRQRADQARQELRPARASPAPNHTRGRRPTAITSASTSSCSTCSA